MSELLDIVNENDEMVGQAPYEEIRASNGIIRVVHVWIVRSDGTILFQQRAANKQSYPLRFDASVGGRVDAGETYDIAATREMKEEMGIEGELTKGGKFFIDIPQERKFLQVYTCKHDGPYTGWEEEAEHIEFMTKEEYRNLSSRFPYLFCDGLEESFEFIDLGK